MNNFELVINGVTIASKILNIPAPRVYFVSKNQLPNSDISGLFRYLEYEILFNEEWVIKSQWIEVLITCFHETRHAYQAHSVKNNINEREETLEKWRKEINEYIMPSGKFNGVLVTKYLDQDIEIDAIAFTHYKINKIFNVKTIIPDTIYDKVIYKILNRDL